MSYHMSQAVKNDVVHYHHQGAYRMIADVISCCLCSMMAVHSGHRWPLLLLSQVSSVQNVNLVILKRVTFILWVAVE